MPGAELTTLMYRPLVPSSRYETPARQVQSSGQVDVCGRRPNLTGAFLLRRSSDPRGKIVRHHGFVDTILVVTDCIGA
jgi:hypothetical protein